MMQLSELRTVPYLRRASVADRDAIATMVERCSADSRYGRFHSPANGFHRSHLDLVLGDSADAYSWAAVAGDDVVGLASVQQIGPGRGELAILVEDAWQRHGVGGRLLDQLLLDAPNFGFEVVLAIVLAENRSMIRMLRRLPSYRCGRLDGTTVDIELDLTPTATSRLVACA